MAGNATGRAGVRRSMVSRAESNVFSGLSNAMILRGRLRRLVSWPERKAVTILMGTHTSQLNRFWTRALETAGGRIRSEPLPGSSVHSQVYVPRLTPQRGTLATPFAALLRSWGRPSPLHGKGRKDSALPILFPFVPPADSGIRSLSDYCYPIFTHVSQLAFSWDNVSPEGGGNFEEGFVLPTISCFRISL